MSEAGGFPLIPGGTTVASDFKNAPMRFTSSSAPAKSTCKKNT
jgi:hypothetical protein